MSQRVLAYFGMLEKLSSEELDRSARELAVREKRYGARLIAHIAEIGERGYHLELRYRNLFEYCVDRLNLSEGSVYRRTQVASVCRRFPQILEALSRGRLHLTGASLIAPHLTEDNVEELIGAACGKTRREVEAYLATVAPKEAFAPSIRKQPSSAPGPLAENAAVLTPPGVTPTARPAPPPAAPAGGGQRSRDRLEPATEDRFNVRFSAGKAFTEKVTRLAEVLGIESPQNHLEEIFEVAVEIALEKKDPKRKAERRRRREARRQSHRRGEASAAERSSAAASRPGEACASERQSAAAPCPGDGKMNVEGAQKSPQVARAVSPEVRERVLERAGHRCEYRGPDGARCRSRTGLQIEHTKPFAVYRTHDERFLRAFCPAHNLFAAERFYGREFVRRKITARRHARSAREEPLVSPARAPA